MYVFYLFARLAVSSLYQESYTLIRVFVIALVYSLIRRSFSQWHLYSFVRYSFE